MHSQTGYLVPVDVPWLRDRDVGLVHPSAQESADYGGGHVAAADEGQLAFLEGGHGVVGGCGWRVQVVVGCGELIPHFDGLIVVGLDWTAGA